MAKDLLFIVNPRAGRNRSRAPLYDAVAVFGEAGYRITLRQTQGVGDAARIARELGSGCDLVVCHGGDGTLNETLNGLMGLPVPLRPKLAYIPGGSTNDFATSLSLPFDPPAAARVALRGSSVPLDVGLFNSRYFAYVASFGAFTRTSYSVPQDVKNVFGHFAYFLEGVKDIETLHPYRMRIETESEVFDGEYLFGAVCNSTSIAGLMKLPPDLVSLSDGEFELMLIPVPKTAQALQGLVTALVGQDYENASSGLIFRHVKHVSAETKEDIPWTLDGEYAPSASKIDISICSGGIELVV